MFIGIATVRGYLQLHPPKAPRFSGACGSCGTSTADAAKEGCLSDGALDPWKPGNRHNKHFSSMENWIIQCMEMVNASITCLRRWL